MQNDLQPVHSPDFNERIEKELAEYAASEEFEYDVSWLGNE
jgi:hypothetical protein